MAVDYNLVVIGGSLAGIEAAKAAASYQARVALVQQDETWDALPACVMFLRELADGLRLTEGHRAPALQDCGLIDQACPPIVDWPQAAQYFQLLCDQQAAAYTPDRLASLGIDVIAGAGTFRRKPRFGFAIAGRSLRANAYLLAPSIDPAMPDWDETPLAHLDPDVLNHIPHWTMATLPQQLARLDPVRRLLIVGGSPETVAIAQSLAKLGIQVTLLVAGGILPTEVFEPETVKLLQAQLAIDGVQVLVDWQIHQLHPPQDQAIVVKASRAGQSQELTIDALCIGFTARPGERMNRSHRRLEHRRSSHRRSDGRGRIADCGYRGGDRSVWVQAARSTALSALKWLNDWPVPPRLAINTVMTSPTLVTIALKSADRRRIDQLQRPLYTQLKAQLHDQTTGFCQLRVWADGKIVGADLCGAAAEEWAGTIALAIQQGLTIAHHPGPRISSPPVPQLPAPQLPAP
jgi:pyruvate/2-oxoglutarate dehydrogenase complex dihydrolipoamide dehydrogenase (E3) component